MKKSICLALLALMMIACGCGGEASSSEGSKGTFRQVTPDEGRKMMEESSGYIIVDVRTQKDYTAGHIQNAICIPNESIDKTPPAELADKNQEIFVYCRSGRRSKEAAQKLANMGYTNIVEFGGIISWNGEVTKE